MNSIDMYTKKNSSIGPICICIHSQFSYINSLEVSNTHLTGCDFALTHPLFYADNAQGVGVSHVCIMCQFNGRMKLSKPWNFSPWIYQW